MFSGVKDQKFCLRMLDPNEYYFDDYSVEYYPKGLNQASVSGTMKVCSKSIVFVPSVSCEPLIRVRQRDISSISPYQPSDSSNLKSNIEGGSFTFVASSHFTIKSSISPSVQQRATRNFYFSLLYVSSQKVISFLQQLNRAAQLHHAEHGTMIAMIAHHRQSLYPFKSLFFLDLYEKECGNYVVDLVEPLVNVPGRIVVSQSRMYFQPFSNAFSVADIVRWKLESIVQVVCRTHILQDVGLEVFIRNSNNTDTNHLLILDSVDSRNKLHKFLLENCKETLDDASPSNMTLKWQNGNISNFEYLSYLNNTSDRTFNNLSQYPIFPWIFQDYTSTTLDLDDPAIYRDLTKPVGALNPARLENLLARYHDMPDPKFLYGSHYSSPGFVTYYLMRSHPDLMLCLMGGKFDHPDRVFAGIQETWNNVLVNSADYKELIPQFYDGEGTFLENKKKINFGKRQNGSVVDHVELPPWATSARDFVCKMRAGLESDYVSSKLNHWIDLIFGYKQRGVHAEQANNVFHHLCYPGAVDLDSIEDPNERNSTLTQIVEFGQVPQHLFTKPHPERKLALPYPTLLVHNGNDEDSALVLNDPQDPGDLASSRKSSFNELALESFSRSEVISVKNHVTFFVSCPTSGSVYVGTSSGLLYCYKLLEMSYLYSAIVSNVSLVCAVDMSHSLCVGAADGKCYFLSKSQGAVYTSCPAHYDTVTAQVLDLPHLFSSSTDSSVKVWQVVEGTSGKVKSLALLQELDHEDKVEDLAVSGALLAACTAGSSVVVWDWDAMEQLHCVDYSHQDIGRLLLWQDKIVLLGVSVVYLDIHTLEQQFSKRLDCAVTAYHFVDGRLVLADSSGGVLLFDMVEGEVRSRLETGCENTTSVYLGKDSLLLGKRSKSFDVFRKVS